MTDIDLPDFYYILQMVAGGTGHALDVEEGQRILTILEKATTEQVGKEKLFVFGKSYMGNPFCVHIGHIESCWLSTPDSRAFNTAWEKRSSLEG